MWKSKNMLKTNISSSSSNFKKSFLRLEKTGADGLSLDDALFGRVLCCAPSLGLQFDVPLAGLELPGLGDFYFVLLLPFPKLLFTAPTAEY